MTITELLKRRKVLVTQIEILTHVVESQQILLGSSPGMWVQQNDMPRLHTELVKVLNTEIHLLQQESLKLLSKIQAINTLLAEDND